jgi:hypothetical protein
MSGGFLEIAEQRKTITVGGQPVEVCAIGLGVIAELVAGFEPIRQLLDNKGGSFKVTSLLAIGRPAVAAVIAAGVGHPGEAEYIEKAGKLGAAEQTTLLKAIYELSFPSEVRGPFEEMIKAVFNTNLAAVMAALPPSSDSISEAT